MTHRLNHRNKLRGHSADDLLETEESQEAAVNVELGLGVDLKNKKGDDYGKDIVNPDEINEWENQYDKIKGKGNKKKQSSEKHEVTEAMTAVNGSSSDRDGEP